MIVSSQDVISTFTGCLLVHLLQVASNESPDLILCVPLEKDECFRCQEKKSEWFYKHCHYWSVWIGVPERNGFWHGWLGPEHHGNIHSKQPRGVFLGRPQWERCVWSNDHPFSSPFSSPGCTPLPNGQSFNLDSFNIIEQHIWVE